MKREEAKAVLYEWQKSMVGHGVPIDTSKVQALRVAIEALQDEAVQGVGRYENAMQKLREMPRYLNGVKAKQIKEIPSEAVQGEWGHMIADGKDGSHWYEYECSHCGEVVLRPYNFCPNCGAMMYKGGDE